jgi:hypothetical protein
VEGGKSSKSTSSSADSSVFHEVEEQIYSDRFPVLEMQRRMVRLRTRRATDATPADEKWLKAALRAHLRAQTQRLERQIHSEVLWIESKESDEGIELAEDLRWKKSLQTIHTRILEGFYCWAESTLPFSAERKLASKMCKEDRDAADLFAEAVLLRLLESLGEHVINAPERISYLLDKILKEAKAIENSETLYIINYDELQDGLASIMKKPNPFEGGLNFDDINDCGARRLKKVQKTFREARNMMVLLDFLLCFRSVIAIKLWCFFVAIYIFLGSGLGSSSVTEGNGTLLHPEWLRANFIQYSALADAATWSIVQLTLFLYRSWQHKGINAERLLHLVSLSFSLAAGFIVFKMRNIQEKPPNAGPDPRDTFLCGAEYAAAYWVLRLIIFPITHRRRKPIYLYGTPKAGRKNRSVRNRYCVKDLVAFASWACILIPCIWFEANMILPITSGMDWQYQCGLRLSVFASDSSVPHYGGACSQRLLRADCAACSLSVGAIWSLVILSGVSVDVFFIFYVFSSIVGFFMGHRRGLNNFKNPMRTVDLRSDIASPFEERGSQAVMMREIFWASMAHSVDEDDRRIV